MLPSHAWLNRKKITMDRKIHPLFLRQDPNLSGVLRMIQQIVKYNDQRHKIRKPHINATRQHQQQQKYSYHQHSRQS